MGIPTINTKNIYTLDEAQDLLPIIWKITDNANKKFQALTSRLEAQREKDPEIAADIDREVDELVNCWKVKLRKLGVSPKGLWLADFDNGTGYYCWKFPERQITHCHGYQDGFMGRRRIQMFTEAVQ